MKNGITTAAFLAALCVVSCVKSGENMKMEEASSYSYTFEIEYDQQIDAKSALDGNYVTFEIDDRVNFVLENDGVPFGQTYTQVKSLTPRPSFGFTTSTQLGEGDRILCWCSSKNYTYTHELQQNIEIPTIQTHVDGKFVGTAMPMVSVPYVFTSDMLVGSNNELDRVKFHNLGSLIEFKIFSTKADLQGEVVQGVTFAADQNIAGEFVFDVGGLDPEDESSMTIDLSGSVEGLTVSKSVMTQSDAVVGSTKDDAGAVRMVVAPGSYTGKVVVNTNEAQYVFNVTEPKSFSRNGYYPLGLDLSKATRLRQVEVDRSEWTIELANVMNPASKWNSAVGLLDDDLNTSMWDCYTTSAGVVEEGVDDYEYANSQSRITHYMTKKRIIPNALVVIDMKKSYLINRISITKPTGTNLQMLKSCDFYVADTFEFKPVQQGGNLENYNTANDGNDWKKVLTISNLPKTSGTWWYDIPVDVSEEDRTGKYIKIHPTASYNNGSSFQISDFRIVATIVDNGDNVTD